MIDKGPAKMASSKSDHMSVTSHEKCGERRQVPMIVSERSSFVAKNVIVPYVLHNQNINKPTHSS